MDFDPDPDSDFGENPIMRIAVSEETPFHQHVRYLKSFAFRGLQLLAPNFSLVAISGAVLLCFYLMRFFWPCYFSAAVIGTAAVYVGAPFARPFLSGLRREAPPREARSAAAVAAAPEAREAGPAAPAAMPDAVAREGARSAPPPPVRDARPAEAEETMPALLGIFLAQPKERPGWGVTRQQTAVFTPDGARLREIPAGTLLEFRGVRASSKGQMIECLLVQTDSLSPPPLVSGADVLLFTGSHKRLSARQRADLQAYYELNGRILRRKNELLQIAGAKNPHFAAYREAHAKLMGNIDRARELAARRDRLTDFEKMQAENHLRELKVSEARLRAEYDAIHARFREWKARHAEELPDPEKDPSVTAWRREMGERRASIAGLAY